VIWQVVLLFFTGVLLSAFFSGSETGFYRVTRVRLALDGLTGDPVSRALLWVVNNPALFVATTLIGNNLANYLVSFAIVWGTQLLMGGHHPVAEIAAPIVVAPLVFVYGELLPKNLFYLAPNRLLRGGGPLFLLFGVLFAPISATLWLLGRVLQRFVGEAPESVRMQLARQELRELLDEGHQMGILQPEQRQMAQAVFDCGSESVARYCVPASRMSGVKRTDSPAQLMRLARRQRVSELLVYEDGRRLAGYVRVIDVYLQEDRWPGAIQPLPRIRQSESHMAAVMMLQKSRHALAEVVNREGLSVGIVTQRRLAAPFCRER
jgi:CBS domain containing-hemolysin-like protein